MARWKTSKLYIILQSEVADLKYTVGLQNKNDDFLEKIVENREHIYEVYFSWGDIPNGRNLQTQSEDYTAWEMQSWQVSALQKLSQNNIPLNILFNANCYGKDSQSRAFFNKLGNVVDYVQNNFGLNSVTTTSPLIAKFIKNNFEDIEVRASVNMEIGTIAAMEYISDYFDSYYMKREYNRDFDRIKMLKGWCDANNKKLFILANSGCLNFCSAHNFHDNLVSHESEIAGMDNAYNFSGVCHEFLKKEENLSKLIEYTNFIRPEDIDKYHGLVDAIKLATRVHKTPGEVLESYTGKKYSGDILRILEPSHSIYPYVLENGNPIKLKKINTDIYLGEEIK